MGLPLTNSFESGQASGTAITTGNSGGAAGNPFDLVVLAGTTTITFDNTHARGTLAMRVTTDGTGNAASARWTTNSVGGSTEARGRLFVYFTALPSAEYRLFGIWGAAGTVRQASVALRAGGTLRAADSVSTSNDSVFALSTDTFYRLEFRMVCSATAGLIVTDIYVGDALSPVGSVTLANANTGTSYDEFWFGVTGGGTPVSHNLWIDDVLVQGPLNTDVLAARHGIGQGRW